MNKKCEEDEECLQYGYKTLTVPKFLLNYMIEKYSVKSLAYKYLGQLLLCLQQQYSTNHPYATFFSR